MSQIEAQAEFADALHRAGLRPKGPPIMDGQKHRVAVEGDSRGRQSGTYIGHLDNYPAGYIHNFKTGEEIRWTASRPPQEMPAGEREKARAATATDQATREAERKRREAVTSHKARALWNRAKPAWTHPYLARKGVAAHGLRQNRRDNLLVPMRDVEGRLWSLQTIDQDGGKLYMRGGRKQGMHALLGDLESDAPVVIAEGFATAATMREATGLAVVVAFDSGNLVDVAKAYRDRDPGRTIIIAADNDHHLPRKETPLPNVGQVKAIAAAEAVKGVVLTPAFGATDKGTDWNDYAAQHGAGAVRERIEHELRGRGVELPASVARAATRPAATQAVRDAARQKQHGAASISATKPTATAAEAFRRTQGLRPKGPTL